MLCGKSVFLITFLATCLSSSQASIASLPAFPSLEKLSAGLTGLPRAYKVGDNCKGTISKLMTAYSAVFQPTDCANLKEILNVFLPKGNGANVDFLSLEKVILGSLSYDTSNSNVDISASYTGTIDLVPNVLSISNFNVKIKFTSGATDQWRYDISAQISIGSLTIDANVVRDDKGYTLTAKSNGTIPLSDISTMFKAPKLIPDNTGLEKQLADSKLSTLSITNPRIKAVINQGYGFLFGGEVVVSNWKPISANVLINTGNDGYTGVTIAMYAPSIQLAKVFKDVFNIDVSSVPVVGTAEVKNFAIVVSTSTVAAPLVSLDIGYSSMVKLPYEKGAKLQCDLGISGVTVPIVVSVTSTDFNLSVTNPGKLTLGKIIKEFMKNDGNAIVDESGKLKNWPTFISFDPLSIGLFKLNMSATKSGQTWSMQIVNVGLFLAQPITLFNNKITISNLHFEMIWNKTSGQTKGKADISGSINGTVTIGNIKEKTPPKADIVIPFPLASKKINITFANFNLRDIAAAFGFTIPKNRVLSFLSRIQLDNIVLTFSDSGKLDGVSVECSLRGTWKIYGSFSVGNLSMSIAVTNLAGNPKAGTALSRRTKSSNGGAWTYTITGHILISTCDILISMTLGQDTVKVEGTGTNCEVSIGQLLKSSNNQVQLPEQISSFALSAPALMFLSSEGKRYFGFAASTNLFGKNDVEVVFASTGRSTAVVAAFAASSLSQVKGLQFLDKLGLQRITILFASASVKLYPYTWRKRAFNQYANETKKIDSGFVVTARFIPSNKNVMGKLINKAKKTYIDVSLKFPKFEFSVNVKLANGGIPIGKGGGKFVGMKFVINPKEIGLELKFSLKTKNADLTFDGSLKLETTATITVKFHMKGEWKEPFGIKGFTLYRLGLQLSISLKGFIPGFGFDCKLKVTPPGRDLLNAEATFCIHPDKLWKSVFRISFSRLLLADIVNLFLNRNVGLPKKIGETGFPNQTLVYLSPAGGECFGKEYQPGIEINGTFQIPFLSIYGEALFVIKIKPFLLWAKLDMEPIIWANGLLKVVSAEDKKKGPQFELKIGSNVNFLFSASCKINIFGASASATLKIDKTRFYFRGEIKLWQIFRSSLMVEIVYGTPKPRLHVIGEMKNDLIKKLKEKMVIGIRKAGKAINDKLAAGRKRISEADKRLEKIKIRRNWHYRKIEEAKKYCVNARWFQRIYRCPASAAIISYHYVALKGFPALIKGARGILAAANAIVQVAQKFSKTAVKLLTNLVNITFGAIDIRYIKFDLYLSSVKKIFKFQCEVEIFTMVFKCDFTIDFSTKQSIEASLNKAGTDTANKTRNKVVEKIVRN